MNWPGAARELWGVSWWLFLMLGALYLVPLLRLGTFPIRLGGHRFIRLNKWAGIWEHAIAPFRDTIGLLYLAGGFTWHVWQGIKAETWPHIAMVPAFAALAAISHINRSWKLRARLELLDFVEPSPTIHPQEFFDHLHSSAGAIRHAFPKKPYRTIVPSDIDFRGVGRISNYWIVALVRGALSTIWFARLTLLARRARGQSYARRVASSLAVIWGARLAQLARAHVSVEEKEKLPPPEAHQIYVFNHMSFLDFGFAPLALAARSDTHKDASQPNNAPRFLLAKDHFRDNFFFYRVLGIGRAAEVLGMIFVDRSRPGDRDSARRVAADAADKLVGAEGTLAIYPQGTRSARCVGWNGERRDSAYYAAGRADRIAADGRHLKKGAAHIATLAAMELGDLHTGGEIQIVPVAVSGTGMACPRGALRVYPNVHIRLSVCEPIVISTAMVAGIELDNEGPRGEAYMNLVGAIHQQIDDSLKAKLGIHAELERRLFEDIRKMLDPLKIEEIAIAMKPWRGGDYLVHATLDAIYACPPKMWRALLGELAHRLLSFSTRNELLEFKGRVADHI